MRVFARNNFGFCANGCVGSQRHGNGIRNPNNEYRKNGIRYSRVVNRKRELGIRKTEIVNLLPET